MKQPLRFRVLASLRVEKASSGVYRLLGSVGELEISSPSPEIFRIRVSASRKQSSLTGSWAVLDRKLTGSHTSWQVNPKEVLLRTPKAELRFSLADGSWTLSAHGIEVFQGIGGRMGFRDRACELALRLRERESLFGLGEGSGPLNRRGLVRDFWNIDVLGHSPTIHPALRSLYVSIPFGLSLLDGRAAGLFWDNPARQSWDMGQADPGEWRLHADSGELDLYLFIGPTVADVVRQYVDLTGRAPMPPRWALGYHQCRYSYKTADEVRAIAREFRKRQIPCDALYLDIHHMDAYRVFTFGKAFPNPRKLFVELGKLGFKVVAIVDPGVQDNPGFPVWKRGVAADAFVKDASGREDFVGEVWPGKSRFPDFLRAQTRDWWGQEQAALQKVGIAGIWNDMNEPANFARPDKTLPPDAVHRTDFGNQPHAATHNLYGMQMSRASREGSLEAAPDARPFIITRSTYAGGQRYAIVWTGDNSSTWDHLRDSIPMLLNLGLSGVPICGADAGGFLDNATPELFIRWLQLAAFTPFFRGHSNIGTRPHEPWAFGPEIEQMAQSAIRHRYQLLQYFYALAAESHVTGAPMMRPLLWHYPNDPVAVARGDQFLVGRDILVAPILEQGSQARAVYLPNDRWYDLWSDEPFTGGQHHLARVDLARIPVFVRAGAILPFIEEAPDSTQQDLSTVTLNVWPGVNEGFEWYEDDGLSQGHQDGHWHRRRLQFRRNGRRLGLEIGESRGAYRSQVQTWRIVIHDVRPSARVTVNGRLAEVARVPEHRIIVLEVPAVDMAYRIEFGPA